MAPAELSVSPAGGAPPVSAQVYGAAERKSRGWGAARQRPSIRRRASGGNQGLRVRGTHGGAWQWGGRCDGKAGDRDGELFGGGGRDAVGHLDHESRSERR